MKILMLHKTKRGGVATYVKEVSDELRKLGLDVEEITRVEDLGITSFWRSYFVLKKLAKNWSKEYDIIHAHDWSLVFPAIKSGVTNLVATFHAFPTNKIAAIFQNYSIRKLGERAIVVSPKMKLKYTNTTSINNGVNMNFFKKVKPVKRDKTLVGIAQKYNEQSIRSSVKDTNLSLISTEGKLPRSKLPEFYSKIGIFVSIPYDQAGFNMVWLEAMACEVPYIIGTETGIGEILPIYKISNLDELPKIFIKIKNGELKPLRNQKKWILKNNLLWKNNAEKLVRLYNDVRN